jgi:hypothetical protein
VSKSGSPTPKGSTSTPRALRSAAFWKKLAVAEGLMVARRAARGEEDAVTHCSVALGADLGKCPVRASGQSAAPQAAAARRTLERPPARPAHPAVGTELLRNLSRIGCLRLPKPTVQRAHSLEDREHVHATVGIVKRVALR